MAHWPDLTKRWRKTRPMPGTHNGQILAIRPGMPSQSLNLPPMNTAMHPGRIRAFTIAWKLTIRSSFATTGKPIKIQNPPTPSETEASETEPGNEAESSQDKQSTRVMKLFGIRKFNDQGDGAGKSYHLQDNMYGNVNLYSVNEDGSPMDFDSALSFFSRNSRLINERVQQLQSQQSKVFQSICGHSPYAPTFPLQISVSYPPTSIYPGRRHLTGTSMRVSTRKALSTKCVSRRRQQDGFRR